jgi:hypothetical protein
VNGVLQKTTDPTLQPYAVWVPMRGGTEEDVAEAKQTLPDPRVHHFWDASGFTLRAFSPVLGLPPGREAWDVYLIYKPGTRWDAEAPPVPDYWMHQLKGVTHGPFFDPETLNAHLTR